MAARLNRSGKIRLDAIFPLGLSAEYRYKSCAAPADFIKPI
ncbi:MAG: hypothetical protein Q4D58_03800 [Synergistaceae bacterium]|nr:hypothetical protein [Synergistaceae bacterium]